MHFSKRIVFYLIPFLLLSIPHLLPGQIYYTRPDTSRNYFRTDFYKQLTTWDWQGQMDIASIRDSAWNWQFSELFQSNLLIPALGSKKWKDEHQFRGSVYYKQPDFDYGLYANSWYQSDEQGSGNNEFGNQAIGLFSSYKYKNLATLTPYTGYQQSKNRNIVDWGWDVGLKGGITNFRLGDYRTTTELESNYDFYDKRQNFDNTIRIGTFTQFNEYTSDSLSFDYNETSKQYYSDESDRSNLTKVKIYDRQVKNRLYYLFSPANRFLMGTLIQSRDLDFVTKRNIFYLENELSFMHFGPTLNYRIGLRTNDETQNNTKTITDSRTRQTALNLRLGYIFDPDKNLDLDIAYVKMQYDTPDKENNDDRDEQRYIFKAEYYQRFSPLLYMTWTAYAYLFHQIYIYAEQSQNNNWNRVFELNPKVYYKYDRISNMLSTSVLANYSVYDFEELFFQTRSFVFRLYTFADSLSYRMFGENYAGLFTRIELEDKGSFFQKEFAQQLVQSYRSNFYNLYLENNNFLNFDIRIGYTIYQRREWRHIPVKSRARDITNEGPYLSIAYKTSKKLTFASYAAFTKSRDSNTRSTRYMTGYLRLFYNL